MVKLAYQTRCGWYCLNPDSMRAKGIPEGESELGGQKYVKDKQARLENGSCRIGVDF